MRRKWVFLAPLGILAIALFIAAGGEVVRLLWNWLLPPIFGWREITFWQAIGMLALCRILFGGHGFGHKHSRGRTPEERELFRQAIRRRFGFPPRASETEGHPGAPPAPHAM